MPAFEQFIADRCEQIIRLFPRDLAEDIYVIALTITFDSDDLRKPDLFVNFNTESAWQASVGKGADPADARWSDEYWWEPHGKPSGPWFVYICEAEAAKQSSGIWELRRDYLQTAAGGYCLSDDKWNPPARGMRKSGPNSDDHIACADRLYRCIVDLCSVVRGRLHERGVTSDICGRTLPIITVVNNDLGDEQYLLDQNIAGNPDEVILGFEEYRLGPREQRRAFEAICRRVGALAPEEQAQYWIAALRGLCVGDKTAEACELDEIGGVPINKVVDCLAKVGPRAVSVMMPILEGTSLLLLPDPPQIPPEYAQRCDNLNTRLLRVMTDIGADASDADVEHLRQLLSRLHHAGHESPQVGQIIHRVANALHHVRPTNFPSSRIDGETNKLLNSKEYAIR